MGHRAGRAGGREGGGSGIGAVYRHLTPEMRARVLAVVDECLAVSLEALAAPMRSQEADLGAAGDEGWPRSDADLWCCGVELRGFEPLASCMPYTDLRAYDEGLRLSTCQYHCLLGTVIDRC
jgi:hypothetical protein